MIWVEPHQVLAYVAEHGKEPNTPRSHDQSIWMGEMAMEEAIKGHDVVDAMHRKGFGWIDFVQGDPGSVGPPEFEGGWGITKIIAKRDYEHSVNPKEPGGLQTLRMLPEIIATGRPVEYRKGNVAIDKDGWRVGLTRGKSTPENPEERWLVSGFKLSRR